MVGQLIVQPSFLAEQHVLLRLVDWSQGHPSHLGSGNIALERAVEEKMNNPASPTIYEAPFSCALALNGRPVGELTLTLTLTPTPTRTLTRTRTLTLTLTLTR